MLRSSLTPTRRAPPWAFALGAALLLAAAPALGGGPAYGVPSGVMPWDSQKYQGYKEAPRPAPTTPPAAVYRAPARYRVEVTRLPYKHTHDDPNVAIVMAHVPDDASLWFEGVPTTLTGMVRYFVSPTLKPGKEYYYTARVQWYEDGSWVSKTHTFPVRPGEIHCLDIVPSGPGEADREVAEALARLGPEDRKAAEAQMNCAVQPGNRLGSMGVPVKVMVKGRPVFLCCEGCKEKALANPHRTLAAVEKLQGKATAPPVR